MQPEFNFDAVQPGRKGRFDGQVYDPAFDDKRLSKQLGRVWALMIDGEWRTLQEVSAMTGDPEASVSAQLRHLRKPRFGSYIVSRRPRGNRTLGLFEYQLRQSPLNNFA